jgi:hypothetical protein
VFFPNCTDAGTIQYFDLVAVCCFQWAEDPNITGLKLVRCMGGETTKDNVVFK